MSPNVKKAGAAFLAATTLLLPFYPVLAAQVIPEIQPLNKPFGGKITKIQACQNPPGFILHIGPPMGGQYFLNPGFTKIHPYGVIKPGVWTLGLAQPNTITCKGNPGGIGGFSLDGLAESASLEITPILNEFDKVVGATISGPLGDFAIIGPIGELLAGADIGGAFGIISSLISGDFLGAGISLITLFDPTGITQVASLVLSLLGINFGKKPPTLGPAYPIIRIGTGPAPSPQPF